LLPLILLLLLLLLNELFSEHQQQQWWWGQPDLFAMAADVNDDMNADATSIGFLSSTMSAPQNYHLQEERKDQVTSLAPTITMTPTMLLPTMPILTTPPPTTTTPPPTTPPTLAPAPTVVGFWEDWNSGASSFLMWTVATIHGHAEDYAYAYVDKSTGESFMGLSPQCGAEWTNGVGISMTQMLLTTTPSAHYVILPGLLYEIHVQVWHWVIIFKNLFGDCTALGRRESNLIINNVMVDAILLYWNCWFGEWNEDTTMLFAYSIPLHGDGTDTITLYSYSKDCSCMMVY